MALLLLWIISVLEGEIGLLRITSYNVCYTKLLRWMYEESIRMPLIVRITSYNVCYTKLLRAADGIRFANAYSAAPVCAPSRGAIFSGKNPARTKFTTVFEGESSPDDRLYEESKQRDGGANNQYYEALHRHNVPQSEIFFAEVLRVV